MNSFIKKTTQENLNTQNNTTSIRRRIFIGFATIAAFIFIAIVLIITQVMAIKDFARRMHDHDIPIFSTYLELSNGIYEAQTDIYKWILTHDDKYKLERNNAWRMINNKINLLNQSARFDNNDKWAAFLISLNDLRSSQDSVESNPPPLTNQANIVTVFNLQLQPKLEKVLNLLNGSASAKGLYQEHLSDIRTDSKTVLSATNVVEYTLVTLLILVLLSAYFIASYTTRGIINYINVFRRFSNSIASGDLTQRLIIHSEDEMGKLGEDLNTMAESLAKMTTQINNACQDMVSTLEEVRHASDIQSSGATEQASSINEITSSLEEIEKSSAQTIDKAKTLGEVAERTRSKGQLGLQAVEQSTAGMRTVREKVQTIAQTILDLSNQTQQVGEITAVVNTLAQQSKMLALNASIEAAKAGEAGKGFAVVAAEVKSLAEQSEHSTSQVQKILEDIRHATEKAVMATEEGIKGVDHGTQLVEQTGDVVRSLSEVIHEATLGSQQIEAAIRQEGIGIEQITEGMSEINQVTHSYVESVNQTIEALNNLVSNVKNLKAYIDIYKI